MSVTIERNGPVTTIIVDRAERKNAVDRPTAEALVLAFEAFEAESEARAAVLWGANGDFCAGADLKALAEGTGNRVESTGEGPMGPTRMHLSKPVIAAIEGYAVAGGLELALWCDLRVASETATLGVFCRRFGVPLIDGGTVRLPRIIGMGRAMDLILTGRPVLAEEALAMGLISRVVPEGKSREFAEALASQIIQFPSAAMLGDRRSAYQQWNLSEDEAIANEMACGRRALEEAEQGAARFRDGEGRHGKFD